MLFGNVLLLPVFLASTTLARNDWSKPCFNGECSYDLPSHQGGPEGTLKIWGKNKHAISDITPASGWIILGCDPHALKQNVRIVCQKDESDVNSCGHLFRALGKSGKLVRLPESCGKNAFGRIHKISVDADQRIPANVAAQFAGFASRPRTVRSIAIDTDFKALNVAETGEVNLAVEGATFPGAQGALARRGARSALFDKLVEKRGFFEWIEDELNEFNKFNLSDSKDIPLISVDKSYNLFNYAISCPAGNGWLAYSASVNGNLHATANAVATVGVAAAGTIVPPDLTQFGVFAALNAGFNGQFALAATASGSADSGFKEIYSVDLPGLHWPGILNLGPVFKVNGQATATLDVDVDVNVNLAYTLSNAKLFFPKSATQSTVGVSRGDSALSLSVNPTLASRGLVTAHVQPRIDIGIDAIAGAATATVSLVVDATASSTLTLNAGPTKSVNGCVDVNAGLNIHAGADASFFGLFDKSTSITLYNTSWDIFNKCYGNTKRSELVDLLGPREIFPRTLSCPAVNVQSLTKLI